MKKRYLLRISGFVLMLGFLLCSNAGFAQNTSFLEFDGGDSFYINDASNKLDVNGEDWTIELWVYPTTVPESGDYPAIISRKYSFELYFRNTADNLGVGIIALDGDGTGFTTEGSLHSSTQFMSLNEWHHIAVSSIFTGGTRTTRLYLDGTRLYYSTDADFSLDASVAAINFGARYDGTYERYVDGCAMDEIRYSKTARYTTDTEFTINTTSAPYTTDDNTILLYHFNENSGTTIANDDDSDFDASLRSSPNNATWRNWDYYSSNKLPLACIWTGSSTTDWGTTGNWDSGTIPISTDGVVIPSVDDDPIISNTTALCTDLTIESDGVLTIEDDGNLTVSGTLTNDGTLTIQSNADGDGSLILDNAANATVERYIVGHNNVDAAGWHMLGSPVATFDIDGSDFDPGDDPSNNDLYRWEETTGYWMNYKNGDPTQIVPGTGYFTSWETTVTKEFSGTLNVADISVSGLTNTTASNNPGWHLLGNPFASALKWNDGNWDLSANVNGTAKIWNSTGPSYSDIAADGIIPSGNGFMVYVSESGASLTIPKASRVHDDQSWYKSTGSNLKFVATDIENNSFQEHKISLNQEATDGFDMPFDSYFLAGYAPKFYSLVNQQKLSTNALPDFNAEREIMLGFEKTEASQFSIRLENEELPPDFDLYLTDLKTGEIQDLTTNPVYLFTSVEGDDPNRFKVTFTETTSIKQVNTANQFSAFVQNNVIHIKGIEAQDGEVHLLDISGRMIATAALQNGNCELKASRTTGVYLVRIITDKGASTKKIFIQ